MPRRRGPGRADIERTGKRTGSRPGGGGKESCDSDEEDDEQTVVRQDPQRLRAAPWRMRSGRLPRIRLRGQYRAGTQPPPEGRRPRRQAGRPPAATAGPPQRGRRAAAGRARGQPRALSRAQPLRVDVTTGPRPPRIPDARGGPAQGTSADSRSPNSLL